MSENSQNKNKFFAMLEQRGFARKREVLEETDSESASTSSAVTVSEKPPYDDDLRALFDLSGEDAPYANRPTTQPVPGMITPIFPTGESITEQYLENQTETSEWYSAQLGNNIKEPQRSPDLPLTNEEPVSEPISREEPPAMTTERTSTDSPQAINEATMSEQDSPALASETPSTARDSLFAWIDNEKPTEEGAAENYTDRYLNIDELYEALALRSKKTDTIYLIEDYLKSIPDSLPDESRRQIVSKIVAASGFDYDLLMGDGILRVKMLKEYAEKFARYTEDYVAARQAELFELENQIVQIHKLIEKRRELHKKQFLTIEAEAGRLREILAFINSSS